jgi:hypothetical protein
VNTSDVCVCTSPSHLVADVKTVSPSVCVVYRVDASDTSVDISIECQCRRVCLSLGIFIHTYIQTTHALSPKGYQRHLRYYSETPTFYQNYLAMSNTADVTGGKPIDVWSQSVWGVNAINPLAFYDIHGKKREVLFFYFVPDTTRDKHFRDFQIQVKLYFMFFNQDLS